MWFLQIKNLRNIVDKGYKAYEIRSLNHIQEIEKGRVRPHI